MNKKEKLIADFKKANKQRRQKIAEKAGFKTSEDYLLSLNDKKPSKKTSERQKVDYVVAFDTTGSMQRYLKDVKAHIEKLIPDLFSNDMDLMMKIIAFGDYCDMNRYLNEGQFGNAYQESTFTNNQSELINFVKGAKDTSGGDEDEFYELVIKKITEETPWREGAKRSVLFIADCNPHKPGYEYYDGTVRKTSWIDWRQEARNAANKNIAFDTLSIHGDRYPWYKELAQITKGVYMPFQSSNKMAEVVSATAYARSGDKMSKAKFKASFASASSVGDTELVGVYKALTSLLD